MRVFTEAEGTVAGLESIIERAVGETRAKSLLVFSCDGNGYTPEQLDPVLATVSVPVFGGIFPVVFHGAEQLHRGNVVVAMNHRPDVHVIAGMSDPETDFEEVLDNEIGDDVDIKTVLVFTDGLSQRIAAFIDGLYTIFGLEINYIGGGAGSLSFKQKPCIITNEGLKEDVTVLAALNLESGVGVSHGWRSISGPYKVTESERNTVKTLDWRPAFEVYAEVVENHSGLRFAAMDFFEIARAYPFGISKMGAERVVRDPVSLQDDEQLVCVGEVPEGSLVHILHGQSDNLVEAAGQALRKAEDDVPDHVTPGLGLFMDCVSRVLFLRDEFPVELSAVALPGMEVVGACTLGEIANSGTDYLEFYNKTAVVAFLEEE